MMLSTPRVLKLIEETFDELYNERLILDFEMKKLLPDTGDGRVTFAIAFEVKP